MVYRGELGGFFPFFRYKNLATFTMQRNVTKKYIFPFSSNVGRLPEDVLEFRCAENIVETQNEV